MKFITFILFCLLLFSCSKKEMIHVSAKNPVTGDPYGGLRFTITEEKTGTQEIFTKVYDNNLNTFGEALFEFKLKKNRSYKLSIETPANNCYKEPADITFAIQDDSFDFKFELVPCANINIKVVNINCQGDSDFMTYRERFSYNEWCDWSYNIMGCFNNSSNVFVKAPSGLRIFNWKVNRNGIITEYLDSIYLDENEYGNFEMNY
jgi:hypothetical protein